MFKRLIAAPIFAGAALSLIAVPAAALAQDEAETEEAAENAAPAGPRTYERINYNVQEDHENILLLDLDNGERVAVRLMPDWAPAHIDRVKTLTRQGFYDGVVFHRVIEGFMAQTGDPTGTGQGGSTLPDIAEEFNSMPHLRGTVSMARAADENSANSQFFITFMPRFSLDKRYTNFGRVIGNMAAVDTINRGEPPANPTRILQVSIAADGKPQVLAPPPPPAPVALSVDDLNAPNLNDSRLTAGALNTPISE